MLANDSNARHPKTSTTVTVVQMFTWLVGRAGHRCNTLAAGAELSPPSSVKPGMGPRASGTLSM